MRVLSNVRKYWTLLSEGSYLRLEDREEGEAGYGVEEFDQMC